MNWIIAVCANNKMIRGCFAVFLLFSLIVASVTTVRDGWEIMLASVASVALSARVVVHDRPKIVLGIILCVIWTQLFASFAYSSGLHHGLKQQNTILIENPSKPVANKTTQ